MAERYRLFLINVMGEAKYVETENSPLGKKLKRKSGTMQGSSNPETFKQTQ